MENLESFIKPKKEQLMEKRRLINIKLLEKYSWVQPKKHTGVF